ncbi:MAG: threonine aldolase family protein [Salinarimonas sp.]
MAIAPVDLRSDTLTRPCSGMRLAMSNADVGDDCFGEDRCVRALEERCAEAFGRDAALYFPTGTMSNQVALRVLTRPGDEIVCDSSYHVNFFEASPSSDLGKIAINPVDTEDGVLTVHAVQQAMFRRARWSPAYAVPKLIWVENTINGHGGRVFPAETLRLVCDFADDNGLEVYMDGARVLNASIASDVPLKVYGRTVTALSLCFAKGLGAPMGSVLVGDVDLIAHARIFRKWYGGALHQSGFGAAAALYALDHNLERLAEDHENANLFYSTIVSSGALTAVRPETNIVIFDVANLNVSVGEFVSQAEQSGIRMLVWRGTQIRAVFSLNATREDARIAAEVVSVLGDRYRRPSPTRLSYTPVPAQAAVPAE